MRVASRSGFVTNVPTEEESAQQWERLRSIDWNAEAKRLLKAAMKRRDLNYRVLADRLARMGIQETEANLRTKISRGTFTAAFFLQCMAIIRKDASQFETLFDVERLVRGI